MGSKELKPNSLNFTLLVTKCLSQNLHHFWTPKKFGKWKNRYPIPSTMILPNVTSHTDRKRWITISIWMTQVPLVVARMKLVFYTGYSINFVWVMHKVLSLPPGRETGSQSQEEWEDIKDYRFVLQPRLFLHQTLLEGGSLLPSGRQLPGKTCG